MGFFSRKPAVSTDDRKLSEVLQERGYIYQHSSDVAEITDGPKRTLYLGIDPTADSMHVGHLQAMLVLRRFLENGHKVIVLLGGGTGMIGDPSGKSEERNLLDEATLAQNAAGVKKQAQQLFNSRNFEIQNNLDWLGKLKVIDFLRDIGKHFSVNAMMARDSVKDRLENREQGISYTEFSYMLLQSYDFLHLFEQQDCTLQLGASDQWGNMVSGVDLIRRKTGKTAYALSFPLLVNKSTGKKFGKSEGGAVWLDPNKTSVFDFYQFWINSSDDDVEEYLLKMTLVPKADIESVMAEQRSNPASRAAQRKLAWEVTALVHGEKEAKSAREKSEALFSGRADNIDVPGLNVMSGVSLYSTLTSAGALQIIGLSRTQMHTLLHDGAVSEVGGDKITDQNYRVVKTTTLKIGKNRFIKLIVK